MDVDRSVIAAFARPLCLYIALCVCLHVSLSLCVRVCLHICVFVSPNVCMHIWCQLGSWMKNFMNKLVTHLSNGDVSSLQNVSFPASVRVRASFKPLIMKHKAMCIFLYLFVCLPVSLYACISVCVSLYDRAIVVVCSMYSSAIVVSVVLCSASMKVSRLRLSLWLFICRRPNRLNWVRVHLACWCCCCRWWWLFRVSTDLESKGRSGKSRGILLVVGENFVCHS